MTEFESFECARFREIFKKLFESNRFSTTEVRSDFRQMLKKKKKEDLEFAFIDRRVATVKIFCFEGTVLYSF